MSPESAGAPGGAPDALEAALAQVESWGAQFAVACASGPGGLLGHHGDLDEVLRVASLTKLATAWAVLVAVEEQTVHLEDQLGPPGATVAHLLAHAGGWAFGSRQVLAAPGTRRIYSNSGYEALAEHVEARSGIPFATYLAEAVLEPLGMDSSELRGSAAKDLFSNARDLTRLLEELRRPVLVHTGTAADACSVRFPGLVGALPGWGRQDPCDWGYGPEIKGNKSPHWTGEEAPPETFGHFGGTGTLMWLEPRSGLGCVALSDRPFDEWAIEAWPRFSDAVRAAARGLTGT